MKKLLIALATLLPITAMAEMEINVPSDPGTKYIMLKKSKSGNISEILTKRIGKSGTSFSNRTYDCQNNTFRYTQEGDSLDQMVNNHDESMSPLSTGSISYYVGLVACLN